MNKRKRGWEGEGGKIKGRRKKEEMGVEVPNDANGAQGQWSCYHVQT